jgi:hypothetical protein
MIDKIVFVIHVVAIFFLVRMLWSASRAYKIPITIHNFPIIILTGLGLAIATYLSITHSTFYLVTGFFVGGMMFVLNSLDVPGHKNNSLFQRIMASILGMCFWPEFMVFFAFYASHAEKIDTDEKSKP